MKLRALAACVPLSGSPSSFTSSARTLRRSALGLLASLAASAASLATIPAAPEITLEHPAGARADGTVVVWGIVLPGEEVPSGLTGVVAIAANAHTVAVKSDGTVVAWGYNFDGQTNVPAGLTGVRAVAASVTHTVAVKSDGTVVAWGAASLGNNSGQAVVPTGLSDVVAVAAGTRHTVALKSDGTVVGWGRSTEGQITAPAGLTGVKAIAAGGFFTVALKSDGTVVAWGSNFGGQTDVPAGLTGVQALAAGSGHTLALKSDGTVVAWGSNARGQTDVPAGLTGVRAVAAGDSHSVALKNDGTVVAWGKQKDLTNMFVDAMVPAGLAGVEAIAAGQYNIAALVKPVVAFGTLEVGTPSAAKTFTIKNTGGVPLNISSMALIGTDAADFAVDTHSTLTTIPATNGATTFAVTFTPSSAGAKSATLRVASDDPDEGAYDIPLTGTGASAPVITAFTTGRKAIDIDVLGLQKAQSLSGPTITLLTQPTHGVARVVNGRVRFTPTAPLPAEGNTFTYYTDDGGAIVTGTVQIVNFTSIAGNYDGLIADTGKVTGAEAHEHGGYLRVSVTATGGFTGEITFAGARIRSALHAGYHGIGRDNQFSSDGRESRVIQRPPQAAIALALRYDAATHTIVGTASSTDSSHSSFESTFALARQTEAGARAGLYTLLVAPDQTADSPMGSSFAAVAIDRAGGVRVRGRLADGTPFDSGSYLHEDGSFALYDAPYAGAAASRGSVRGLVQFQSHGGTFAALQVTNDAGGTLAWFKPARARDDYFPAGFAVSRDAELSRYLKPARGTRVLDFSAGTENGRLIVDHPGLTIDQRLTLPATNRAYAAAPNAAKLHLDFDLPSGFFRGHFTHPATHQRTPFAGAVFQLRTMGAGYFLGAGPTDGCSVVLQPADP